MEEHLAVPSAVLFLSARGALAALVEAIAPDSHVAVPAYTCVAVPNAVISAERRPVYVDVDARGLVAAGSWPRYGLRVVQDTFGFRADEPADGLFVRDSAHRAHPLELGNALAVVTSFEHSKGLSAGRGGLVLTKDRELGARLRSLRDRHGGPPSRLPHAIVTLAILVMGRLDYRGHRRSARLFRRVAYKLAVDRLKGQSELELRGRGVDAQLLRAPDGTTAALMLHQLRRAAEIARHRANVVSIYDGEAGLEREAEPLVRYPLRTDDPERFERQLLEHGWNVRGRWFASPLHPQAAELAAFEYAPGSFPTSEMLARTIVNLPTHTLVRERDARELITLALSTGAQPI